MGRASKQTYLGRVVYPAQFHEGVGNGKPFLTFTLFVDKLAVNEEKERISGKINCSYSVNGDQDPVAHILSRIFTKDDPQGMAGQTYKYVDVFVEGNEKLTEVSDEDGRHTGAYYKSLDFCSVQVVSSELVKLYRKHMGYDTTQAPADDAAQAVASANVQQPTMAPSSPRTTTAVVQQATPVAEPVAPTYKVGDTYIHKGVEYRFNGGDPSRKQNWTPVNMTAQTPVQAPVQQSVPPPAPPAQRASKARVAKQMPNAFSEALEDSGIIGGSPFEEETDNPV